MLTDNGQLHAEEHEAEEGTIAICSSTQGVVAVVNPDDGATEEDWAFAIELCQRWNLFEQLTPAIREAAEMLESGDPGGDVGTMHRSMAKRLRSLLTD